MPPELYSEIACPQCGHRKVEQNTDRCPVLLRMHRLRALCCVRSRATAACSAHSARFPVRQSKRNAALPGDSPPRITAGVAGGLVIGTISSLLGVAGGEVIIPTLVIGYGAPIALAGSGSAAARASR